MEKNNTIKEIVSTTSKVLGKAVVKGIAKTILNFIFSYAGPVIDGAAEIAIDLPTQLKQKRRETYFKKIEKRILRIEERYIDTDYFRSKDFIELAIEIEEAVIRTRSIFQIDFFSKLFIASVLKDRATTAVDWQISFIRIISDLNEAELICLQKLDTYKNGFKVSSYKENIFGLSKEDLLLCVESLLSKGLIIDMSLGEIKPTPTGGMKTAKPQEIIKLNKMAKKLIEFMQNSIKSLPDIEQQ